MLIGLSSTGYAPVSQYAALACLQATAMRIMTDRIEARMRHVDQRHITAMKRTTRNAYFALSSLQDAGYESTLIPDDGNGVSGYGGCGGQVVTSLAVSRAGWEMTTFPGDSCESYGAERIGLTVAKLYTFVIPLCHARMDFGDLGHVDLSPGVVVALLAAKVPHSLELTPHEGEKPYVVTGWTEDRAVRLAEYDAWLRNQPQRP